MASVTSKNCPNCGAPVPLKTAAKEVTCPFCGNLIHIEWTRHTPAVAQPLTLYVQPKLASPYLALFIIIPVMLIGTVVSFVMRTVATSVGRSPIAEIAQKAGLSKVTFPVECGLNQELEITDQIFEGEGTLITGGINCKIRIKNSKLKGTVVVLAKNLVEVTLDNSTITGTESAIKIEMNSQVEAKNKSAIVGGAEAIDAGLNAKIRLSDSRIEGQEVGIKTGYNLELSAKASTITGKNYGIRSEGNLKVNLQGATLRGERAAVMTNYNLGLEMRGGKLEGGETAVTTDSNANIQMLEGAELVGRETGLKTSSNLELRMEGSSVSGGEVGVDAGVNPKLHLGPKAVIRGKRFATKLSHNLELEMRDATIESEQVALCAGMNAELAFRNATLRGGLEAIRMQRKPNAMETTGGQVTGKQNFAGKGCFL